MNGTRRVLNLLIVVIAAAFTLTTVFFIRNSISIKEEIRSEAAEKAQRLSETIYHCVLINLNSGHGGVNHLIADFGKTPGIRDIAIFGVNGAEAFGTGQARLDSKEFNILGRTISSGTAGFFSTSSMTYESFMPLGSGGRCSACHEGAAGVLRVKISSDNDRELLLNLKRLTWALGLIVFFPALAFAVTRTIIREKNRIFSDLEESSINLKRTLGDLAETRHYLQMILDNSKVFIITTDIGGRIVEFNKEAENLLGYRKEEVVGKSALMLYEDPAQRLELIEEGKSLGKDWAVKDREVVLRKKSGEPVQISLTISSMVNNEGEIIGTVGIGKDVSEEKMLRFKLLQSEKLASIGTLATGIAHEINNPLAGILGMAEAARDEEDMTLIKSYLQDIIKYTNDASSIVRELSSYSRSLRTEGSSTVELSAVIENTLKMAKLTAHMASIKVVTELEPDTLVIANQGEMQQVFVNLIANAVHAMGMEGTLTLECSREGEFVKVVVADTGCGIPEEHLGQIYDPFFTTKAPDLATGLGLYVVYRVVMKYNGTIDVKSKAGRGTTFTLKFPSSSGGSRD